MAYVYSTKLVKCVRNGDVFFSVAVCLFYLQSYCKYFDMITCHWYKYRYSEKFKPNFYPYQSIIIFILI